MSKGGMCARPFGGADRLDRIDFTAYASGSDSPYKLLYLHVISDAASDYLFYGFGKNGTVPDDFWYAKEYFFTCRSHLPETWQHAKFMRKAYVDEESGKRVASTIMLSDEELKQGCFDRHYELAGLNGFMPFDRFVEWLKIRRAELITLNQKQVNDYIDLLQSTALAKHMEQGIQVPFRMEALDRMQVLVSPESPEQVAEMIYYTPRYRSSPRARMRNTRVARREDSTVRTGSLRYTGVTEGQIAFALS